jgi:hypothetical protein
MQFSFKLLRMKGPFMFQGLLAHPQKVLHKRHMVYCERIPTEYTKCRLLSAS